MLPTVPSYDPWSWIVWGREVVDPHLLLHRRRAVVEAAAVVFTSVWGLFGGAGPTLWVITARTGGLLGLVAAYRLAGLCPGERSVAVVGPCRGGADRGGRDRPHPGLVLLHVPRHLGADADRLLAVGGRPPPRRARTRGVPLGVAASLIRPEAWPFIFLYAIWLWRREPRLRLLLAARLFSIPFLWFVPPWIGSGQPFLAARHAKDYNGHLGNHPFLEVLRRGVDLQVRRCSCSGSSASARRGGGVAIVFCLAWPRRRRGGGCWSSG